jgi:hypothetical protein
MALLAYETVTRVYWWKMASNGKHTGQRRHLEKPGRSRDKSSQSAQSALVHRIAVFQSTAAEMHPALYLITVECVYPHGNGLSAVQ